MVQCNVYEMKKLCCLLLIMCFLPARADDNALIAQLDAILAAVKSLFDPLYCKNYYGIYYSDKSMGVTGQEILTEICERCNGKLSKGSTDYWQCSLPDATENSRRKPVSSLNSGPTSNAGEVALAGKG